MIHALDHIVLAAPVTRLRPLPTTRRCSGAARTAADVRSSSPTCASICAPVRRASRRTGRPRLRRRPISPRHSACCSSAPCRRKSGRDRRRCAHRPGGDARRRNLARGAHRRSAPRCLTRRYPTARWRRPRSRASTTWSIRSPNPERAVALYAGRLGLSLRLDRSEPAWGARLLFFRCGDLDRRGRARPQGRRRAMGPTGCGASPGACPTSPRRMRGCEAAGIEVSDIRVGPPPGTRGLHREEPHGRRADADDRRCARMKRKWPLARPPRIDPSRGAVTGSGGTWPSRCCW